ncbi:MAG: 4Fe-4S binding protein [Desulfobacterales bacterium]|nr:4Fe-4S binding protein [Desulfobacterales bacterium]MCF8079472.1 4Fe-4S binding protein [Desulfobacterales bacterium]
MTLIQVDSDKCLRDGICAAVCPAQIISFGSRTDD